jgi:hypothetical protein
MNNRNKNDKNDSDTDSDKNTTTKFDGYDHHIWKFEITNKLQSKGLWKIVNSGKNQLIENLVRELNSQIDDIMLDVRSNDASSSVDTNSSQISNYDRSSIRDLRRQIANIDETVDKLDKKAIITINRSLSKKIKNKIISCQTSKDVWDTIERHYGVKDKFSLAQLKHKYNSFVMQESGSLNYYLDKLNQLRNSLETNNCPINESDHVHKILQGLPSRFNSFVQAHIASNQDISAMELENRLLKLKSQESIAENREKKGKYALKSQAKKCTHCNKTGHLMEQCWALHGKPDSDKSGTSEEKSSDKSLPKSKEKKCMVANRSENLKSQCFYLDSGATDHLCNNLLQIKNLKESSTPGYIRTSSGEKLKILGTGEVELDEIILKDVLYVPDADANLISLNKVTQHGYCAYFQDNFVIIKDKTENFDLNGCILKMNKDADGMYSMFNSKQRAYASITDKTFHERYGHYNDKFVGETIGKNIKVDRCEACLEGKMTKRKVGKVSSSPKTTAALQKISLDIVTFSSRSIREYKYALVIIDHFSSYTSAYLMKHKNESDAHICKYIEFMQPRTQKHVQYVKHDNDLCFKTNFLKDFLIKNGTTQVFITEHDKTQLGTIDRKIRDLEDRIRCLLATSNLPNSFWCYALEYSIYIMNNIRKPSAHETMFSEKSNTERLRVFGCLAFVHIRKDARKKEDSTAQKMILIGINEQSYLFLDPKTGKTQYSIDCKFQENMFHDGDLNDLEEAHDDDYSETSSESSAESPEEAITQTHLLDDDEPQERRVRFSDVVSDEARYPTRDRKAPQRLAYMSVNEYEPKSFAEVFKLKSKSSWVDAMEDEHSSLVAYNTWIPVKRERQKIVGTKWVYKFKSNGTYKARFVAKGYSQIEGLDYDEVFAGVADFDSIRLFLCISFNNRNFIGQADVNTAFLNGNLEEEIYIEPPQGFEDLYKGQVLRLNKALYGLKQAGRQWLLKFKSIALKLDFKNIYSDSSIYFKNVDNLPVFILLYVDDLLMSAKTQEICDSLISEFNAHFKLKNLGKASLFIGWKLSVRNDELHINQESKVLEIIEKYEMLNSNVSKTPMQANLKLSKSILDEECDFPYRSLIGSLNYIARGTRPDIMFAVYYLARFQSCYSAEHVSALKNVLKYLKATSNYGLIYKRNENPDYILKGYCDADFGTDEIDRKSVSGFCFFVNDCLIAWNSKKQATVAKSTVEAEYQALSVCISEAVWLRNLLSELGYA